MEVATPPFEGSSHASRAPVYSPRSSRRHPPSAGGADGLDVGRHPTPGDPATSRSPAAVGQAVWDALRAALPRRRRTLERRLLPALHAPLPKRPKAARVALDYHRIPYYGAPDRNTTRAKSSAGTHTFHTYATACVVGGPGRYTLGLTAVHRNVFHNCDQARALGEFAHTSRFNRVTHSTGRSSRSP